MPKKINCLINNQVTYPCFISDEFINFSESLWIVSVFLKIFKSERNVTNFDYIFGTRFHITHKNFSGNWTNSCTVLARFFFKKGIFIKVLKNWKNWYGFWKINNLISNEKKRIGYLIIYWTIIMKNECLWHLWYGWFFLDFCYIANYWNSDRTKLLVGNVRAINP